MVRIVRVLAALSIALTLSSVPLATVSACSCAMATLPDAIRAADVAIVGSTLSTAAAGKDEIGDRVLTTWAVERSRDPIDGSRIGIESWRDSGANCGIGFADSERWLVLAYSEFGALTTNGCLQNLRLDGSDPDAEAVIAELITEVPSAEEPAAAPVEIPAPIIAIGLTALVVVVASVIAFRREVT
jgi:hypothetical protein